MEAMTVYPAGQDFGRPSKYNDKTLEKTCWYFDNWKKLNHAIPSIAGLADHLEVDRGTIHRWANDEEKLDFCNMLSRIATRQELVLLNQGLTSELNSSIVKIALTHHGYHEKSEVANYDMVGNGGNREWNIEIVDPEQEKVKKNMREFIERFNRDQIAFQEENPAYTFEPFPVPVCCTD